MSAGLNVFPSHQRWCQLLHIKICLTPNGSLQFIFNVILLWEERRMWALLSYMFKGTIWYRHLQVQCCRQNSSAYSSCFTETLCPPCYLHESRSCSVCPAIGLCHLTWCPQGLSTLLKITGFLYFLRKVLPGRWFPTVLLITCCESGKGFQVLPPAGTYGEGSKDLISRPSSLLTRWLTSDHHLQSLGVSFFSKIKWLY